MPLSDADVAYLQEHHSAAMVTIGSDGRPKPARVSIALVDGRLWSSSTADRVRTKRLRRDPRCTLFVFDDTGAGTWLGAETTVTILDGPDAAEQNLRLMRAFQGRPEGPVTWFGTEMDEPTFLAAMAEQGRLIYEFDVERTYGLH